MSKSGVVYLLRMGDSSVYKLGRAGSVDGAARRLAACQTGCAETLYLAATFPVRDCRAVERELHEKFALVRRRGEWFELSAPDLRHIVRVCIAHAAVLEDRPVTRRGTRAPNNVCTKGHLLRMSERLHAEISEAAESAELTFTEWLRQAAKEKLACDTRTAVDRNAGAL